MKIPPKRNEFGLIDGVIYAYHEDGTINWRAMVAPEHLYPNKGRFQRFNKPVPKSAEGLDDDQLLIKLAGIKELAKLRGFTEVKYEVIKCELNHVAVKCGITWIGNYESEGKPVYFEDIANATAYNTSDFALKFLETIAVNRSFVRCVRNFLHVHIVGWDEIDSSDSTESSMFVQEIKEAALPSPQGSLEKMANQKGYSSFEQFKVKFLREIWKTEEYQNEDTKEWSSYSDMPSADARKLMAILRTK